MTKPEIIADARSHNYDARYSSRQKRWFFSRIRPSGNIQAMDNIVLANLKMKWGVEPLPSGQPAGKPLDMRPI